MVTYCNLSRGFLVTTAAYAAVAAVTVVLSGCDRHRSFHQNFDLEAGAFLKDQSVVALCDAIERNDLELMQRLIDGGVDVNARGKDNVTPLLWAYPDNKAERFELLLKAGADPNVKLSGNLGIPAAFKPGDSVTLKSATSFFPHHFDLDMRHGGDPNITSPNGSPILHELIASGAGDVERRVKTLIGCGGDVNAPDCSGWPPTITAISAFQQYNVALLLLDLGCDHRTYQGEFTTKLIHSVVGRESKLHLYPPIAQADHQRLLQRLIDLGEDADQARKDNERWANPWKYGMTPGNLVRRDRAARALREELEKDPVRAFRHAAMKMDGPTFQLHNLLVEPTNRLLDRLEEIIERGANVDHAFPSGETAAMMAVRRRKFAVAAALLRAGGDPTIPRIDPKTARTTRVKLIHYVDRHSELVRNYPPQQRQAFAELVGELAARGEFLDDAKKERHFWRQPLAD